MYQLTSGTVIRFNDGAAIPADPENRDYCAYLAWCAEGNTPLPEPAPEPEPPDPDANQKRTAIDKLVKKAGLDAEDVRVLFDHGLDGYVEPPTPDPAQAAAVGKIKAAADLTDPEAEAVFGVAP